MVRLNTLTKAQVFQDAANHLVNLDIELDMGTEKVKNEPTGSLLEADSLPLCSKLNTNNFLTMQSILRQGPSVTTIA